MLLNTELHRNIPIQDTSIWAWKKFAILVGCRQHYRQRKHQWLHLAGSQGGRVRGRFHGKYLTVQINNLFDREWSLYRTRGWVIQKYDVRLQIGRSRPLYDSPDYLLSQFVLIDDTNAIYLQVWLVKKHGKCSKVPLSLHSVVFFILM